MAQDHSLGTRPVHMQRQIRVIEGVILAAVCFSIPVQARRKHFLGGTATGEGILGSGHPSEKLASEYNIYYYYSFIAASY